MVNRKRRLLQLVLTSIKYSGARKDKSSLAKMKLMYLLIGSGAVELSALRVSSSSSMVFVCLKGDLQGGTSPLHAAAQAGNDGKTCSIVLETVLADRAMNRGHPLLSPNPYRTQGPGEYYHSRSAFPRYFFVLW